MFHINNVSLSVVLGCWLPFLRVDWGHLAVCILKGNESNTHGTYTRKSIGLGHSPKVFV